jgi:hypothetical protein
MAALIFVSFIQWAQDMDADYGWIAPGKELKGIGANGFEVESEFDFSGSSESLLLSTR